MISSGKSIRWSVMSLLVLVWGVPTVRASVLETCNLAQILPTAVADTTASHPCLAEVPVTSKIASPLQHVVQHMQQDGVTATNVTGRHPARYSTPVVRVDARGRVHTVILVTTFDLQVESALATHQVVIERVDVQTRLVQAWIPFDRLETVAALSCVRYLRPPSYASRR